jgi:prophage regulatory protein
MLQVADFDGYDSWAGSQELEVHADNPPGLRKMLGMSQVLALVPFSRSTLYREMDEGRFPKAREIAPWRIAWYEDDVIAWQKGLRISLAAPQA